MRNISPMLATVVALFASACTETTESPASPSAAAIATASAAADGSTLKVTAPTPQSPINGQQPQTLDVVLSWTNAAPRFPGTITPTYRLQVFNGAGAVVYEVANIASGAAGTTTHQITVTLDGDVPYGWQVRAESGEAFGPWSSRATFVAPSTTGYIRGPELYDPLFNGKTVGSPSGPVTFVPGVGIKLETQLSYVAYQLGQTLTEGEFSLLVTNMPANTDGDKTKLFAMAQGFGDVVTNDRRMTVEKRGDPPGIIAWRFITHGDQVDTEGAERTFYNFLGNLTYFWQATWRNNRFNLLIKEGGVDGRTIYNIGKNFQGRAYDPNPHVIYLGAPVGRSGEAGASVDGVIIRQVWVSGRARPAFASK